MTMQHRFHRRSVKFVIKRKEMGAEWQRCGKNSFIKELSAQGKCKSTGKVEAQFHNAFTSAQENAKRFMPKLKALLIATLSVRSCLMRQQSSGVMLLDS